MRSFQELFDIAVERHGSIEQVLKQIPEPSNTQELSKISGDAWLSRMTRAIFHAGFSRKVIDGKWDNFNNAFDNFDVHRNANMSEEKFDALLRDASIVRNGARINAVRRNAIFILRETESFGSFGASIARFKPHQFLDLLDYLKSNGDRLGYKTAQYMLRAMGVDGYILSVDVVKRLRVEGVIEELPKTKSEQRRVQEVFDDLRAQSGKNNTYVSRILAMSIESDRLA